MDPGACSRGFNLHSEASAEPRRYEWFALTTKSRREKSTAQLLSSQQFECSLPVSVANIGGKSSQKNERVLFPGYVFCKFNWNNRLPILITPGVMSVVTFGNKPTPVDESEIYSMGLISRANLPVEVDRLVEGQRVRIEKGVLTGVEGVILRGRGKSRVAVNVDVLQRSVLVEIDVSLVRPVRSSD